MAQFIWFVHDRYASSGNSEALRKLIIDLDADINLPMKDGTTPSHCAAENGQEGMKKLPTIYFLNNPLGMRTSKRDRLEK